MQIWSKQSQSCVFCLKVGTQGISKVPISNLDNGENVSHLEITEVVLVHCNIVNNDY